MGLPAFADALKPKNEFALHLNLGSIQGESSVSLHNQEIVIVSFSVGASISAVRSAQNATKGGKPTISEITVIKHFDKATPQIFSALVSSTLIPKATISMSKSTGAGKPEDYMVITLTEVFITSQQITHSHDLPPAHKGLETIMLNYQAITIDIKVQLPNGLLVSGGQASYNLALGK
jgi:type VI secretion system secreted protein Hcp